MPTKKRYKTNYKGVYFTLSKTGGDKGHDKHYYIIYRRRGRQIEEKIGSYTDDKLTPSKAAKIRKLRINSVIQTESRKKSTDVLETRSLGNIVGRSEAMIQVYDMIKKSASTETNVLIYGESGTGKELVANAIHNLSSRKKGPFIVVNCGAIPENLLESEFFGYKKGAFTGAVANRLGFLDAANNGTLFLDEIAELNLSMQVKLLRVIEGSSFSPIGSNEQRVSNIRILGATNRNLKELVTLGKMREDFFYRLHIIPIYLPPLRKRKEDIPLLINHFINKNGSQNQEKLLDMNTMQRFQDYSWPGNVRELQNTLQRYFTIGKIDFISKTKPQKSDLFFLPKQSVNLPKVGLSESLRVYERYLIEEALKSNQGDKEKTADCLDLSVRTLYNKLKYHNL